MSVIAKFYCSSIERAEPNSSTAAQVHLGAVCRGAENAMWASYTPAGSITMSIRNDAATDQFEEGAEYEVTFTRVDPPQLGDGHQPVPAATSYMSDGAHSSDLTGHVACARCGVQANGGQPVGDGPIDWSKHWELYQSDVPMRDRLHDQGARLDDGGHREPFDTKPNGRADMGPGSDVPLRDRLHKVD